MAPIYTEMAKENGFSRTEKRNEYRPTSGQSAKSSSRKLIVVHFDAFHWAGVAVVVVFVALGAVHLFLALLGGGHLGGVLLSPLGPPVLEPDLSKRSESSAHRARQQSRRRRKYLHLRLRHAESVGQLRALGPGEVLCLLERLLECEDLLAAERRPRVLLLVVLLAVGRVRTVRAAWKAERNRSRLRIGSF